MPAERSNKYYALTATLIFHGALLLILMFTILTTPDPPFPDSGGEPVLVNIGIDDAGSGDVQPMAEVVNPEPVPEKPEPQPEEANDPPPVTSDEEETIKVEEVKPKKEKKKEKKEKPKKTVEPVEEEPVKKEPEKKVNPSAIYKGAKNNSKSEGDDKAGTPGDKGVPDGGLDSKVYTGASGNGKGGENGGEMGSGTGREKSVKINVQGRKLLKSPVIKEKSDETGKIVVSIVVDQHGSVIKATAGARGSTINNSALYKSSEEAALRAKFDAPDDSPEEQRGTITFIFVLK